MFPPCDGWSRPVLEAAAPGRTQWCLAERCRDLWFPASPKLEGLFTGKAACVLPPGSGSVSRPPGYEVCEGFCAVCTCPRGRAESLGNHADHCYTPGSGRGWGEGRGQGDADSAECRGWPEGLHHQGERPGCAGPPSPSRLPLRDFLVLILSRLFPLGLLLCSCLLLIASFSKSHSGCFSVPARVTSPDSDFSSKQQTH